MTESGRTASTDPDATVESCNSGARRATTQLLQAMPAATFALLVGSVVDYAIYMLDTGGHIVSWNAGAERIKGYHLEDVIGQHFSLFYTPEERAAGLPDRNLAAAARDGRCGAEGWRVRKDGSRFWASVVIDPVFDNGKLIGFAKVTRDVTARRDAELALRESERMARGIIDTALDGFVQVDEAGLITEWNPCAAAKLGWKREQVLGRALVELVLIGRDRERHATELPPITRDTSLRAGNPTLEMTTRDGRKLPVELSISTLPLSGGVRYNVFFRDLSDKLLIETQLRQAQKMEVVGQLTSGIAHDFNNLLQGVIGALELIELRSNEGRADEIGPFVRGALTSANRAAALTHRLLAFSRRQPLDPRPLDANPLIKAMGDLLQRTLGENIAVRYELAAELWPTLCDPNQLENALLNLAINAADAMPEGGRLVVRSHNVDIDEAKAQRWPDVAPGEYISIDVIDTGVGMPPEVLERAFDPFFTTKQPGRGTGLGLSMVYGFAHQSNGHCEIHSRPGEGTTVRIYLPRHEAAVIDVPSVPAKAPPEHVRGHDEQILVVEDEPIVRNIVVEVLHQLGYQTLEAADAEAGLDLLRSGAEVAMLISDIGLPGMDGRQFADAARALHPQLRVLLMSGYASAAISASGFLGPGMVLVTKPFTVEVLASRVASMMAATRSVA
ncbi:MAG: PAS domain S-box protein [Rhodanobacter sp.]